MGTCFVDRRRLRRAAFLALGSSLFATSVLAAEPGLSTDAQPTSDAATEQGTTAGAERPISTGAERPKWELGIGSVLFTQPDYVGSDEYRFRPIPFPWIIYRGTRLRFDRESMQTRIFGRNWVRLDLSAGGQVSVDSSRNDRRRGMSDLDWMAQIGPSLRFTLAQSEDGRQTLELDIPLRAAFAIDTNNFSYEGLVSSPRFQYRYEPDNWRFESNAGLEFSNNDYNEYIYDVPFRDVTATRPEYDAKGGYGGVRFSLGVSRYFGRYYVGLFARYLNLDGAAFEHSPLVATHSAFTGGIAVGWTWFQSDEMVPVGAAANLARRRAVNSATHDGDGFNGNAPGPAGREATDAENRELRVPTNSHGSPQPDASRGESL